MCSYMNVSESSGSQLSDGAYCYNITEISPTDTEVEITGGVRACKVHFDLYTGRYPFNHLLGT